MKKVIRLTEADLTRIIKRVMKEEITTSSPENTSMDINQVTNGPITAKIEECAQDLFGPGPILTEIPTCVWLAQYHLSTKKNKFDKNDKYDKVKIPACRRELEKAESNGEVGAVYTFPELMNCLFNCISCFSKDSIANF